MYQSPSILEVITKKALKWPRHAWCTQICLLRKVQEKWQLGRPKADWKEIELNRENVRQICCSPEKPQKKYKMHKQNNLACFLHTLMNLA